MAEGPFARATSGRTTNGTSASVTSGPVLDPDLPLPGAYPFDRVIPLELPADAFTAAAASAGVSLESLGVITKRQDGSVENVDDSKLADFFRQLVPAGTRPSLRLASAYGQAVVDPARARQDEPVSDDPKFDVPVDLRDDVVVQGMRRDRYLQALAAKSANDVIGRPPASPATEIGVPAPGLGQSVQEVRYDVQAAGTPRLALVETWQVSTFLGDYGLGRTLQTFTLLPGESTTISLDTWRTDASVREDASSIFDSNDIAAQDRYSQSLGSQSGAAFQDQGGWSLSVGLKASASAVIIPGVLGGSASLEAGFAANHQEARQTFTQSVSQTTTDHASQVNESRRQSVSQTQTDTTQTGSSQSVVRQIANTNLRRVLNFVFRELNQEYETITSLKRVRLAFFNGHPGSAEIVPLSGLAPFLTTYLVEAQRDTVARSLLALVCQCLDEAGTPQTMLQVGSRSHGIFQWEDATLREDGTLDFNDSPLAAQYSWRIAPGPLGQDQDDHQVDGVVTGRDTIVLRTDNVVGEGLLGAVDCLDPYAAQLQEIDLAAREADVTWRSVQTRRTRDALDLVQTLDEKDRVAAYHSMLVDPPPIEVVSAATATSDNHDTP